MNIPMTDQSNCAPRSRPRELDWFTRWFGVFGGFILSLVPTHSTAAQATPTLAARAAFSATTQTATHVRGGTVAHYRFFINNVGNADLKLVIQPECGCTTAYSDPLIAPGHMGVISADVQTEPYWRSVTRDIRVMTNDPTAPVTLLHLIADVVPVLNVVPAISLGVNYNTPVRITREFTVVAEPGTILSFGRSPRTSGPITAVVSPQENGRKWLVSATLTPPADGSDISGSVELISTDGLLRPVVLQIVAQGPGLSHSPPQVEFGLIDKSHAIPHRSVLVYSRSRWFHITAVRGAAGVEAHWERVPTSYCLWRIDLTFSPTATLPTSEGTLSIITDAGANGTILVPYRLRIKHGPAAPKVNGAIPS